MKLPGQTISLLDKQEAVGGTGGSIFDSGCNVTGLRKVHMEQGKYDFGCYRYVIKRIYLEFNNHTDSNQDTKQERHPQYFDYYHVDNKLSTFELNPNDHIIKVNVWSDDDFVTGISFFLMSGTVSQLYGLPSEFDTLTTFEGKNGATMVGIHGYCSDFIDRLGITFAKTMHDDLGFPPNHIDDASWSTLQKEIESSCTVTTTTNDKKEDESWADVNDGHNDGKDMSALDGSNEGTRAN
jgi:hypothetical protein